MKSIRIALPTAVHGGTHLVQPSGSGADTYRAYLVTLGPVTSPVLESLRAFGLRELNGEAEDLVQQTGSISARER